MISINETGFLPDALKLAVSDSPGTFHVIDDSEGHPLDTVVTVTEKGFDETAGSAVYKLDFSDLTAPGVYHLESDKGDRSAGFKIEPHVYRTLKNSLLKFFYFQRCGCALEKKYAGIFEHGICHTGAVKNPDTNERLTIPKGWHDAGDYGRYTSAGSVAVAHMLYAYELFPEAFKESVNIPESGNGIPDLLNECRYELEFLSKMQAEDGGLHHKVTTFVFCDFIMPEDDTEEQVLFPVTSMSTADFAAVMCIASRVYEAFDPSFARECMHQAYLAGQWLLEHPENTDFHNPPGSNTGEYTDPCDLDERMWAFAELLRTDHYTLLKDDRSLKTAAAGQESRQDRYLAHLTAAYDLYTRDHPHSDGRSVDDGMGWQDVSSLAALAVVFDPANIAGDEFRQKMTDLLMERADAFYEMQQDGYPLSMKKQDFVWGSNMLVSNRADVLILASLISSKGVLPAGEMGGKTKSAGAYETAALNHIHYLLGMNAMETSYVTGFGEHAFRDPHNRVAIADNIAQPIPGELSGGPCYLLSDEEIIKVADSSTPVQKCYADHHLSYSTNEIAIYWNSSLLFAVAYFDR